MKALENRGEACYIGVENLSARVAQLDRASVYGTEGYRFESCRACSTELPLASQSAASRDGENVVAKYEYDPPSPVSFGVAGGLGRRIKKHIVQW